MPRPKDSNWNEPAPRSPAPQICPVFVWPTPDNRDFLFYVERNGDLPANQSWTYGDPYLDQLKYPRHKLVYVSPQDPSTWSKWYYAAEREDQDEYNWAFSEADIGGTKFKSVVREYVTLRSEFDPVTPAQGSVMANAPKDKFAGAYVLAGRDQIPNPTQEIASIFVFEKLTYVQKVSLTDNVFNEELDANLSSVTTLYYRGETVGGTPIETLVANEKSTYWGLTGTTARLGQQLSTNWFLVVEKKISVRRGTDGVYTDAWPLKQIKSRGTEASIPTLYADQVSSIETITRETLAAGSVDDIPDPTSPVGIEARNLHKKINDLFYEKSVLSQEFSLTGEIVETDIEQRPYVKITQNTKGELAPNVPGAGMGSSKLIWKGGQQRLFANMDQDSVARPGLKGFDKEVTPWGYILERTDYSENYEDGEKSRVIYDDGETRVYEVSNLSTVFIDSSGTTKDKDPQAWGFAEWNGIYTNAEDSSADRIKVVWQRGAFKVWLNEKVTARISGGTRDKDPQQWGTLTWVGAYSETEDTGADKSRQVWRIGDERVFLNETASASVSGTTKDVNPQQWGSLIWTGTYSLTEGVGDTTKVNQVFRLGDITVYHNEEPSVTVVGDSYVSYREENALLTEVHTTSYGLSPIEGINSRSRIAFGLGTLRVYENTEIVRTSKGTRTYPGTVNVDIPAVLNAINASSFTRRDGNDSYHYDVDVTPGYRGPMPCSVEEYWQENPGDGSIEALIFRPRPVTFSSPLGGFNVGETIHGNLTGYVIVGTQHPVYVYSQYDYDFPATTPDEIPSTFVADVNSQPYQDGYIVRIYRVTPS